MSREIEFRAWDDKDKYWYPAETIISFFDYLSEKFTVIADWFKKDAIILEQYTGLRDKNGKKIYEGDIVLDYYDGEDAFIVKWDKDTARFILTDTDNIASVSFDNSYSDKDLEVVGNIHENLELLGGEE